MGQEDSMQSPDGLLIGALIHLNAVRFKRAAAHAKRILKWKDGIAISCMILALMYQSSFPTKVHEARAFLVFFALFIPWMFGLLLAAAVNQRAQIPADEENGKCAARILTNLDMSSSYATTFVDLLGAIMDDDAPTACALADELDACGSQADELTTLVRQAF